jgi:upstream activation factor subunit UAF30
MAKAKKKPAAKKVTKKAAKKAPAKKVAKKPAAKTPAAKKVAPKKAVKKAKRKPNPALMAPMTPSPDLAEIVGAKPQPRGQITKGLWAYIKKNGLQDATNKRQINADEKLKKVLGGKSSVSMFEMTKLVSKHIS